MSVKTSTILKVYAATFFGALSTLMDKDQRQEPVEGGQEPIPEG